MSKKRTFIVFGAIIVLGLVLFFLVSEGFYPIALISGRVLSAREFSRNYQAAALYYKNLVKTYEPNLPSEKTLSAIDLQVSVLNQLIENRLVDEALSEEVQGDLKDLVEAKISKLQNGEDLKKAVQALYGLSYKDFEEAVLVPQAKLDILTGRLFLRGKKIEEWLTETKAASKVIIFSREFTWDGKEVKVNDPSIKTQAIRGSEEPSGSRRGHGTSSEPQPNSEQS